VLTEHRAIKIYICGSRGIVPHISKFGIVRDTYTNNIIFGEPPKILFILKKRSLTSSVHELAVSVLITWLYNK
jgi:hypothetical protein